MKTARNLVPSFFAASLILLGGIPAEAKDVRFQIPRQEPLHRVTVKIRPSIPGYPEGWTMFRSQRNGQNPIEVTVRFPRNELAYDIQVHVYDKNGREFQDRLSSKAPVSPNRFGNQEVINLAGKKIKDRKGRMAWPDANIRLGRMQVGFEDFDNEIYELFQTKWATSFEEPTNRNKKRSALLSFHEGRNESGPVGKYTGMGLDGALKNLSWVMDEDKVVVDGTWATNGIQGRFVITFEEDAKSFKGRFQHPNARGWHSWTGNQIR